MADAIEIVELRGLINEPDNVAPYTDEVLSVRIDAYQGTLRGLAGQLWQEKAARYAGLVDIKEGSSDRKLSQLHTQALAMATAMGSADEEVVAQAGRVSRTRPIERQ